MFYAQTTLTTELLMLMNMVTFKQHLTNSTYTLHSTGQAHTTRILHQLAIREQLYPTE